MCKQNNNQKLDGCIRPDVTPAHWEGVHVIENQMGYKTLIISRSGGNPQIQRKGTRGKKKTYASDIMKNSMFVK